MQRICSPIHFKTNLKSRTGVKTKETHFLKKNQLITSKDKLVKIICAAHTKHCGSSKTENCFLGEKTAIWEKDPPGLWGF